MTNSPELPQLFEDDINLNGLFDILNPKAIWSLRMT